MKTKWIKPIFCNMYFRKTNLYYDFNLLIPIIVAQHYLEIALCIINKNPHSKYWLSGFNTNISVFILNQVFISPNHILYFIWNESSPKIGKGTVGKC